MADETVAITARTSLEAMNSILALVGNSPATDYNSTSDLDVILVRQVIEETSLEVQEDSWQFNRELEIELTPNGSDEVVLSEAFTATGYTPSEIARIDFIAKKNCGKDIIIRGGKAYDRVDHTYEFTSSIYADVVWYLPWLDIPNDLRYYITVRAARKFAARRIGSDLIDAMLREQEGVAYTRARGAEMDRGDYNALKNNPVLRRSRRWR
jgi:hypothetical protein